MSNLIFKCLSLVLPTFPSSHLSPGKKKKKKKKKEEEEERKKRKIEKKNSVTIVIFCQFLFDFVPHIIHMLHLERN